ncbi:MAG: hypothetical protein DI562_10255 [Stenotrophomonas acidaminiphila]|nr:MAG: hypothetical protein DI562_10255 [Stenotrophomonas acidaminiphila]
MKQRNRTMFQPNRKLLSCALASCLAMAAPQLMAQSTSATLRGAVTADSTVTVTNVDTGLTRTTKAANGNYNIGGLPPGTYRIEVNTGGQTSSRAVTLAVGQTATLNLQDAPPVSAPSGDATTLDTVRVTAPLLVETKTSEVATYVSQRQIEALPQTTRNFLAFADTVPGMIFEQNPANGATKLRSGAQSANNINVYIDGVGQKNYVIKGGITGQDSSRGNPFPQMAIGEYKVITSNYKAEYDQISSAAVTAVTKSGTNEFSGSFFWDYTNEDWRTAKESEKAPSTKTQSKDEQYGFALGGPIVKDLAHFFVSYEAKEYQSPQDVVPGEGFLIDQLPAELQQLFGNTNVPFKEDLYFGKLSWTPGESHLVELTFKKREETGISGVGGQSAFTYGTDTHVTEDRYDLRWQYSSANWLNDAHLTYEEAYWAMEPVNYGNGYILTNPPAGTSNNGPQLIRFGAGDGGLQDKGQEGWALQNDLSFFGWEGHTLKMGVKYKQVDLNTIEQQPYNPQFYYDINEGGDIPYIARFGSPAAGSLGGVVKSSNKQFGIYFQDDWAVTEKLTVNLGLRWDYEKTPAYLDYVTEQAVIDSLAMQDDQAGAAVGQTYAQTLALGGIDINRFISNGNNRDAFKDAWQPRLGFSYDLFNNERHVIFGGIGRAYDRNLFDYLQLELTKSTFPQREVRFDTGAHPCAVGTGSCLAWDPAYFNRDTLLGLIDSGQAGREVFMFQNDLKVPYSDQFSIGMRNTVGVFGFDWNTSVTLQHIRAKDGLLLLRGNRRGDGSYFDPANGSPWSGGGFPGAELGNLIIGTNGIESKTNALLLSAEKPYTSESPWNLNIAYTFTDAEQNIHEQNPEYGWYYPAGGWFSGAYTPEHRLVISGFTDLPWGISASGKLTLASQIERWGIDPSSGYEMPNHFKPDGTLGFKQFDLSLAKTWDTGTDLKLKVRADVLNVFDWVNWSGYGINWDTGNINTWDQFQTRTFKLSFGLDW